MQEPAPLADHLLAIKAQGFRAFKIGWGPFGRHNNQLDEEIVRAAREAVGNESMLMVDAGGSDAFWSQGYKWALRTADMLAEYKVDWFEEALRPDNLEDYALLRKNARLPISGGEVLTRRQSFLPWLEAGAFDIVQPVCNEGGWHQAKNAESLGWPTTMVCVSSRTAGIRRSAWLRISIWLRRHQILTSSST